LLGGNGTGKSTVLKTVSGFLKPWQGTVLFDGERIDGLRPDRTVQRGLVQVTQGKEAYPAMTVEENLRLGAYLIGDRGQLCRSFERVYDYFPGSASGGGSSPRPCRAELQMLCIGRGLCRSRK
jgi:branched-chain amino acid transport system ATP-binding protein